MSLREVRRERPRKPSGVSTAMQNHTMSTISHEAIVASERRGPARKRVLIPAIVVTEDGAEYRCILRDMSASGAKIGITRRNRLPKVFKLVTGNRGNGYRMRLAWQRGDFAGMTLDPAGPAAD